MRIAHIQEYTRKYWPYLLNRLQDGRLAISSNLAERSIKPFVTGRKNFLFANVPRGEQKAVLAASPG